MPVLLIAPEDDSRINLCQVNVRLNSSMNSFCVGFQDSKLIGSIPLTLHLLSFGFLVEQEARMFHLIFPLRTSVKLWCYISILSQDDNYTKYYVCPISSLQMNRRRFLKQSSVVSLGGLLVPSVFIQSCRKQNLFDGVDFKGNVIIVGAGIAGLYAGKILKSRGINFTILEASNSYGGRMGKKTGFADYDIDTGAQWLHGRNNILGDLAQQKNVDTFLDPTDYTFWFNQQRTNSLPKDPFIFEEENLPDISFLDYAIQQGFGPEYYNIIEAIAGDQGADASLLSAYWNYKDEENWNSGDDDFKFSKTYFDFIDEHIAKPIAEHILYETQIIHIDYSENIIRLHDATNGIHTADKVIITVPISILKLNEIEFTPPLPVEKTNAFAKFGMGPGMKVFLKFSSKFYVPTLYGGAVCGAYLDDTIGKNTDDHVLLAFAMGDQAFALHSLGNDEAITQALLQELDEIYDGQASAHFIASSVHNYTDKPFIKGAYSYSTLGMGNAREVAAQPIQNKLFFAGEAVNTNGHHQTVHGAAETGYRAVIELLTSVSS
jgi:monoamine oxidase